MVEKMKYINITGPVDDLDRVVDEYLSQYDIQLEDAVAELKDVQPFHLPNPYTGVLRTSEKLLTGLGLNPDDFDVSENEMSLPQAIEIVNTVDKYFGERSEDAKSMTATQNLYRETIDLIDHYANLDIELTQLAHFAFIGCRFGHMPISSFRQFEAFLYDDQDVLLVQGKSDGESMWLLYFVPDNSKDKVDSVLSSLHFERVTVPFELNGVSLSGTPAQITKNLRQKLEALENDLRDHHRLEPGEIDVTPEQLLTAHHKIKDICYHFDARKHAARSSKDFYVFVGWMAEKDAYALQSRLENDDRVVFIIEEDSDAIVSEAPTKLRNHPLAKPFEFFVRMYGLPAYGEIDPTPFVAVTYTLIFGLMFGDVGQGAILSGIGWYLYLRKKIPLGAVMAIIGVSSMVFGVLYGSVFGMEDIIPAVWLKPAHSITQILFITVGLGIGLIVMSMLLNMLNAFRKKDWGSLLLGHNGLTGLLFYGALVFIVYAVATGKPVPDLLIAAFIVIPLALMALKEPITERHEHKQHVKLSQFLLETVIELFEVLLSYFTNTVSFVRIGAFALSHAGMMSVVLLLSESAEGRNPAVLILGNLFVIALEGLVVGIQVLRLEFYEMFSRFFSGSGREFVSYRSGKQ